MSGVLEGIRVLDFGRYIAGPFCGTMLADLGADVQLLSPAEFGAFVKKEVDTWGPVVKSSGATAD